MERKRNDLERALSALGRIPVERIEEICDAERNGPDHLRNIILRRQRGTKERGIMNADEIMRALKSNAEVNHYAAVMMMAADLIESLTAQLAASQRRAQYARNELCLKCGEYKEAHNGACNGCRWKEWLREAQRWIPCAERLPTVSEYRNGDKFKSMDSNELVPLLVCCEDTEIPFRAFYDGKNWGDGWGKQNVTHWMPLPKLPEVEHEN